MFGQLPVRLCISVAVRMTFLEIAPFAVMFVPLIDKVIPC